MLVWNMLVPQAHFCFKVIKVVGMMQMHLISFDQFWSFNCEHPLCNSMLAAELPEYLNHLSPQPNTVTFTDLKPKKWTTNLQHLTTLCKGMVSFWTGNLGWSTKSPWGCWYGKMCEAGDIYVQHVVPWPWKKMRMEQKTNQSMEQFSGCWSRCCFLVFLLLSPHANWKKNIKHVRSPPDVEHICCQLHECLNQPQNPAHQVCLQHFVQDQAAWPLLMYFPQKKAAMDSWMFSLKLCVLFFASPFSQTLFPWPKALDWSDRINRFNKSDHRQGDCNSYDMVLSEL